MLWNINTGNTYILKRTIKVEIGSEDLLPKTLHEFEQMDSILKYEDAFGDLKYHYDQGLVLLKLKKGRK